MTLCFLPTGLLCDEAIIETTTTSKHHDNTQPQVRMQGLDPWVSLCCVGSQDSRGVGFDLPDGLSALNGCVLAIGVTSMRTVFST